MRLSFSLIEHYLSCQYRTKVLDIDRVPRPPLSQLDSGWLQGELRHEAQKMICASKSLGASEAVAAHARRRQLALYFEQERVAEMCSRAVDAADRWARHFQPQLYRPATINGHPLIDRPLYIPLSPPLGAFHELVIKPDFVGCRWESGGDAWELWDWKWSDKFGTADDLRYDLQSAIYQYGLIQLRILARPHGQVVGMLDEPTTPSVNKDGSISRRAIRCDWETYARVVREHGHDVNEYSDMRERLLPFFATHVNYRSTEEVEHVWADVVAPIALQITESLEEGFARRMSKYVCTRCAIREDCLLGLRGLARHDAFNTIWPYRESARDGCVEVSL